MSETNRTSFVQQTAGHSSVNLKTWSPEFVSRDEDKQMIEEFNSINGGIQQLYALLSEKDTFQGWLQQKSGEAYKLAMYHTSNITLAQHRVEELTAFPFDIPDSIIAAVKQQFGATTLADLRMLNTDHFETLHGVGPAKAAQLNKAVRDYDPELTRKTRLDLKLATKERAVYELLRIIYLLRFYGKLVDNGKNTNNVLRFIPEYENADIDLIGLISFTSIIFPRTGGRNETRKELAGILNKWMSLNPADAIDEEEFIQETREARLKTAPQVIYNDFLANSAAYYAVLSTLAPEAAHPDKAVSGAGFGAGSDAVHNELWDAVKAVELNLSLFKSTLRPYQDFGVKFAVHQKRLILGDDMGLGKSAQSIALMSHISATASEHITHLVVAPKSVQENWSRELKLHSMLTSIMVEDKKQKVDASQYDVIITTYERVNSGLYDNVNGAVIVDEAHLVKNPETQRTQRVLAALEGKEYGMFLTGTAIENDLEELTNLITFVNPGLRVELAKIAGNPTPDAYRDVIAASYLRRNKEDVLTELPELTVKDEWVQMSNAESGFYADALGSDWHAVRKSGYKRVDFSKITRMREIVATAQQTGEKVLIFSFYLEVLDTVARAFPNIPQVRVDGSVDASERQKLVDEFSNTNGTALFISQISTGGVGLNLQSASRVILCEPQIKFSLETQAIARAHRMGQLNPVIAHRLATVDTLDERIVGLRNVKEKLFDEYARDTELGDMSVDLEDEAKLKRDMLAEERAKYGVTSTPAAEGTVTSTEDDEDPYGF